MRVQHTGFTIDSQVVGVTDRNIVASPPPPPWVGIFVLSADPELLEGEREAAAVVILLLDHLCPGGGEGGEVAGDPGVEAGYTAGVVDLLPVFSWGRKYRHR